MSLVTIWASSRRSSWPSLAAAAILIVDLVVARPAHAVVATALGGLGVVAVDRPAAGRTARAARSAGPTRSTA